jgi:hypothetical protein
LVKAVDSFSCGRKFPYYSEKTIQNENCGEENWTHTDYVSTFDPAVDEFPGSPDWRQREMNRKRIARRIASIIKRVREEKVLERRTQALR